MKVIVLKNDKTWEEQEFQALTLGVDETPCLLGDLLGMDEIHKEQVYLTENQAEQFRKICNLINLASSSMRDVDKEEKETFREAFIEAEALEMNPMAYARRFSRAVFKFLNLPK